MDALEGPAAFVVEVVSGWPVCDELAVGFKEDVVPFTAGVGVPFGWVLDMLGGCIGEGLCCPLVVGVDPEGLG